MFRLVVLVLVSLMGDWIFFGGDVVLRPLATAVEAGADVLADLVFRVAG